MKSSYIIDYINENEFKKKERAIKKYNMLAYKKLLFDYIFVGFYIVNMNLLWYNLDWRNVSFFIGILGSEKTSIPTFHLKFKAKPSLCKSYL